ncbi:MAG: dTDP-4-dehydrorhamnose 3,5-epimerase family protein [Thermomicrobiales bacterium]
MGIVAAIPRASLTILNATCNTCLGAAPKERDMTPATPRRDPQRVDEAGAKIGRVIDGVTVSRVVPVEDDRGELCELWTEARDMLGLPVRHSYMVTLEPGKARGWVMHERQYDRVFILRGRIRLGLYDARPGSPTEGVLSIDVYSERNRVSVVIPPGVWHGFQNVGHDEAWFVNFSTQPYDYQHPDKVRQPLVNDMIPFAFEDTPGW